MTPSNSFPPAGALAIVGLAALTGALPDSRAASDSAAAIRFFGTGSAQTDRVTIQVDDNAGGADASTPADIGAGSFTIEFCVRGQLADNTAASQPGGTHGDNRWINGNIVLDRDIWSDGTGNPNDHNRDYGISFANGRVMFGTGSNGADAAPDGENTIVGSLNVLDGAWHHVACVRDVSDGSKSIYVDGVLDFTVLGVSDDDISYPDSGVGINPASTGANNTLVLGAEKHDAGPAFPSFNGYFDELRLWSAALPLECLQRYRSRVLLNPTALRGPSDGFPDLAAYYRFEEGGGIVAGDSSGLANNAGTVVDGTPGMAEWVTGASDPANTCAVYNGTEIGGPLTGVVIENGFTRPLFVTAPPGDNDRLFIVEQGNDPVPGRIKIYKKSTDTTNPVDFLTLAVHNGGNEEGLLGMAFHPSYATNGVFYIYYSFIDMAVNPVAPWRTSVVERYTVSANPDIANPAGTVILQFPQPFQNHNAGWLGFNPTAAGAAANFLHIAAGDGGSGNDPRNSGQATQDNGATADADESLLGRILRVDTLATGLGTGPAAGNRWIGDADPNTNSDYTWIYGLRNPWRSSFDRLTGDYWCADVGQANREEVNVRLATTLDSADGNYGWRLREGFILTPTGGVGGAKPADNVDPILDYEQDDLPGFVAKEVINGQIFGRSITGGYVYRGPITGWQGTYFFGDARSDKIWSLRYCDGIITELTERTSELVTGVITGPQITSFGEDNAGNLYYCSRNGNIVQITVSDPWHQWRNQNFTAAQLADDALSGPLGNLDGDTKNTIEEFISGGDPAIADAPLIEAMSFETDGGIDEFLTLTLTKDPQSDGVITIEGESGADLDDFDNANTTGLIDNATTFKFRDNVPMGGATRRFGHFKFTLP